MVSADVDTKDGLDSLSSSEDSESWYPPNIPPIDSVVSDTEFELERVNRVTDGRDDVSCDVATSKHDDDDDKDKDDDNDV